MDRNLFWFWFVVVVALIGLIGSVQWYRGQKMAKAANKVTNNAPVLIFDLQAENISPCEFATRYGELCQLSLHLVQVGGVISRNDKNVTCDDLLEIVDGLNEAVVSKIYHLRFNESGY